MNGAPCFALPESCGRLWPARCSLTNGDRDLRGDRLRSVKVRDCDFDGSLASIKAHTSHPAKHNTNWPHRRRVGFRRHHYLEMY